MAKTLLGQDTLEGREWRLNPEFFIVVMAHISGSIYNRSKIWFTPYAGISLIDVLDVYIVDMYSCCLCEFYLCIL